MTSLQGDNGGLVKLGEGYNESASLSDYPFILHLPVIDSWGLSAK
jgi:hypothetical protein